MGFRVRVIMRGALREKLECVVNERIGGNVRVDGGWAGMGNKEKLKDFSECMHGATKVSELEGDGCRDS